MTAISTWLYVATIHNPDRSSDGSADVTVFPAIMSWFSSTAFTTSGRAIVLLSMPPGLKLISFFLMMVSMKIQSTFPGIRSGKSKPPSMIRVGQPK